jgi:hypothetical protein
MNSMHSLKAHIINKRDPHLLVTEQFGLKPRQEQTQPNQPVYMTAVGGKLSKVAHEPLDGREPMILGGSDPTDKKKGLTIKQILKNLQNDVNKIEEENYSIVKVQDEEKKKEAHMKALFGNYGNHMNVAQMASAVEKNKE